MTEKLKEILRNNFLFKYMRDKHYSVKFEDYNQPILKQSEVHKILGKLLTVDKPLMVSRLGSVELSILKKYIKNQKYGKKEYVTAINNAGIFPAIKEVLDGVSAAYTDCIAEIDILGIWANPFEDVVANKYCPDAKLTALGDLEPFFSDEPWTYSLAEKKVLVINPFASSIEAQYEVREKLFENPKVLPQFDLLTYKSVQSVGGNQNYDSWFDALEKMKCDISKIDFDIAIIGAGAYGLPLACHIKKMGKKAIHLGGVTQMLFGVYGKRWEQKEKFNSIINSNWIKPKKEETPLAAKKVENGCYW